jgi:cell division protein FtsW
MVAKVVQKTNPEHVPRVFARVATWEKRVDTYFKDEKIEDRETSDANYQIEKAKTAIATGGLYGLGPGKSVQKNFLPQSASDFIFAIIVEEYGLIIGGLGVMTLYLLLFFRFIVTAHKAQSEFGRLLIIGLGFPIIFQAMINMAVAVQLLPVTGQTLPLLSSGGSSIWVTCLSIGIIISVTKKHEEVEQEQKDKEQNRIEQDKRAEILNKLIDGELEKENSETDDILESKPKTSRKKTEIIEESDFSISESNPMNAVINKK